MKRLSATTMECSLSYAQLEVVHLAMEASQLVTARPLISIQPTVTGSTLPRQVSTVNADRVLFPVFAPQARLMIAMKERLLTPSSVTQA